MIEAKEETYNKAKFIVTQMVNNIEAIESFLLFYLIEDTYDDSKDTIHDIKGKHWLIIWLLMMKGNVCFI